MDTKQKNTLIAVLIAGALASLVVFLISKFKNKKTGYSGLTPGKKMEIDINEAKSFNQQYFKTLSSNGTMYANSKSFLDEMINEGINNIYTQAGMMAVVSKESNFILKRENLDYTSDQLIKVFDLPIDVAKNIAHKPELIANTVYMPPHNKQLGNTSPGDGWLFRGGSYNQITGRYAYDKYGKKIGVDLVSNPDKINDPIVAAKVTIAFFKDGLNMLKTAPYKIINPDGTIQKQGSNRLADLYNNPTGDINGFKNEMDAAAAFYNVNAGAGQTIKFLMADVTGGRALCMARANGFVAYINSIKK